MYLENHIFLNALLFCSHETREGFPRETETLLLGSMERKS